MNTAQDPEPIDPRELAARVLDRHGGTLAGDDLSGADPQAIARKIAEREAAPTTPAELARRVLERRDGDLR